MGLKICHISDTHGAKYHSKLEIPESDVLVHTGDIGGRTTILELTQFLEWFEKQPARKKIFIAGNHDINLDKNWVTKMEYKGTIEGILARQAHLDSIKLIENYDIKYLNNKEYIFEGVKFWGSPYSPSFHRDFWVFNADRGQDILKEWSKIPTDVNVLLTHTPCYGILDDVKECKQENEMDAHVGCKDLLSVIKKRLHSLKLHCSGHIHNNLGIIQQDISNTRKVLFSNGAVIDNNYNILITKPFIINI